MLLARHDDDDILIKFYFYWHAILNDKEKIR